MRYTSIPVQVARKRLAARLIAVTAGVLLANACSPGEGAARMTASEKKAVADSLKRLVVNTYDLSKPEPVKRLMSLYPDTGRVISASGGGSTTPPPPLGGGDKAVLAYFRQKKREPGLGRGCL